MPLEAEGDMLGRDVPVLAGDMDILGTRAIPDNGDTACCSTPDFLKALENHWRKAG